MRNNRRNAAIYFRFEWICEMYVSVTHKQMLIKFDMFK